MYLTKWTPAITKNRLTDIFGKLPCPLCGGIGHNHANLPMVEPPGFIRDAQASGLTLAEVQSLLSMKDAGVGTCGHTLSFLDRHIAEIDEQITRLQASRAEMVELAERARRLDPAACTDPNRCQVIDPR